MCQDVAMVRIGWLLVIVMAVSGCGREASKSSEPSATDGSVRDESSLVGLDMPDEYLVKAGMEPVRTLDAACALLFDERDVPALAAGGRESLGSALETSELQSILMSVAYSGPDALRDNAADLVDHLDLPADYLNAENRGKAQLLADGLSANCDASTR